MSKDKRIKPTPVQSFSRKIEAGSLTSSNLNYLFSGLKLGDKIVLEVSPDGKPIITLESRTELPRLVNRMEFTSGLQPVKASWMGGTELPSEMQYKLYRQRLAQKKSSGKKGLSKLQESKAISKELLKFALGFKSLDEATITSTRDGNLLRWELEEGAVFTRPDLTPVYTLIEGKKSYF